MPDCSNSSVLYYILCTYTLSKLEFTFEAYSTCVSNIKHRNPLSRFRSSAHKLAIEEGRHRLFLFLYVYANYVTCIKLRMNTMFHCYVLPTLIEKEVVYQDSTGHGHQYTTFNC